MRYMQGIIKAAAALTIGAACMTAATAQEPKLKVVFPAVSETLALPFRIAQDKGWVNADYVQVSGDANALRALLSGSADIAVVGDFNVFMAVAEGAPIKAINSWQGVNDYQMVVSDKIKGIQDMAGKAFASTGPGAPPQEFSKLVFAKHGINPNQIQYVALGGGGHAVLLQSVLGGRVSGTLVSTTDALTGEKTGKVRILQSVAQDFPKLGYVYNVVRAEDLKNPAKRAALQAFVTAGIKASRYIASHPDEAAKFAVAKFPSSDPGVLTKAIHLLSQEKVWGINGGIEPDTVSETLRIARNTGLVKKDVSTGQVFDYQLVDASLKQLGKQ